jgi:hypothetical protein
MRSTNPSSIDPDSRPFAQRYPTEGERLARLVGRWGEQQAREWARRTAAIYRASVLNPRHFAHVGPHRRQFVQAYLELKRFARQAKEGELSSRDAVTLSERSPVGSGIDSSP